MVDDPTAVLRDPARLAALRETALLDTRDGGGFDRLTRLASRVVNAPVAMLVLVEDDRQYFASHVGLPEPYSRTRQTPLTHSFCQHVVLTRDPLVIEDARAHPDFHDHPAIRDLGVVAYLGIPLKTPHGHVLGSFCVIDHQARQWSEDEVEMVGDLAHSAMTEIELRLALREAEEAARAQGALREGAQAVAARFTEEEVVQEIARGALAATRADGAFVKRILAGGEVEVVAVAGERTPQPGSRSTYAGSFTQRVVEGEKEVILSDIRDAERPVAEGLAEGCAGCSGMVVPLLDAGEPLGALVLLRGPDRSPFREDDIDRARTFADLVSLALRKVHLLQESERRREELERITQSRARLMRGFSHDVKNPLGAADGYAHLLEDGVLGDLTARQTESVGRIRRSIRAALNLIEDLLELARAEAGQIALRRGPTDVREAVREMAEEYRAQANAKGLDMEVRLPADFPVIDSDADRVRQVLGNLISNAVKYTREGQVTVQVDSRTAPGSDAPCIAVDVEDTGPGIASEKQHLLFQEFVRLDPEADGGAGIGLAISRGIALALGGDITIDSRAGQGSTFTLWLPLNPLGGANGKPAEAEAAA